MGRTGLHGRPGGVMSGARGSRRYFPEAPRKGRERVARRPSSMNRSSRSCSASSGWRSMRGLLPPPKLSRPPRAVECRSGLASSRTLTSWWSHTECWRGRSRRSVRSRRRPNGSSTTSRSSMNKFARSATTCRRTTTASSPRSPRAIWRATHASWVWRGPMSPTPTAASIPRRCGEWCGRINRSSR